MTSLEMQMQSDRIAGELTTVQTELAGRRLQQSETGDTGGVGNRNEADNANNTDSLRSTSARRMVVRARIESLTEQSALIQQVNETLTIHARCDGRVMMRDEQSQLAGQNVMQSQWCNQDGMTVLFVLFFTLGSLAGFPVGLLAQTPVRESTPGPDVIDNLVVLLVNEASVNGSTWHLRRESDLARQSIRVGVERSSLAGTAFLRGIRIRDSTIAGQSRVALAARRTLSRADRAGRVNPVPPLGMASGFVGKRLGRFPKRSLH